MWLACCRILFLSFSHYTWLLPSWVFSTLRMAGASIDIIFAVFTHQLDPTLNIPLPALSLMLGVSALQNPFSAFLHCTWLAPRGITLLLLFNCMYRTLYTSYVPCTLQNLAYPIQHCMMLTSWSLKNPSCYWHIAKFYFFCFYVACSSHLEDFYFFCFYITFAFYLLRNSFSFSTLPHIGLPPCMELLKIAHVM